MGDLSKAFLAIVGGAFSLAMVSVILSRGANTSGVVQSVGSALSNVIGAATKPVTSGGTADGGGSGGSLASAGLLSTANDADSLLASFGQGPFFSKFL